MKKTILKITAMIMLVGFINSCKNETKESNVQKQTEKVEKTNEHQHSKNNGLVLNNGKLWIANSETTEGVDNMIRIMNSFSEKENVKAYGKLTKDLKSEFTMIFQKCTMTGESHNQLHNFLVPIKDLFETLPSSDLTKCKESYTKLNVHLKEYKKYFK